MASPEDVKLPPKYRPLLRRLQRGTWTARELQWLLDHDPQLPWLLQSEIRGKLQALQAATGDP